MGTKYQIKFKDTGDAVDDHEYTTVRAAVVGAREAIERRAGSAVLVVDVINDVVVRTVFSRDTVFYCRYCNEEIYEANLTPPAYSRWYACPLCGRRVYKTRVPAKERYRVCHPVHATRVLPDGFATIRAACYAAHDLVIRGVVLHVRVVDDETGKTVREIRDEQKRCSRCNSLNDGGTFWKDRGGYARLCDDCFAAWNKGAVPDAPVETVDVPNPVKKMERRLRFGNGMPHNS